MGKKAKEIKWIDTIKQSSTKGHFALIPREREPWRCSALCLSVYRPGRERSCLHALFWVSYYCLKIMRTIRAHCRELRGWSTEAAAMCFPSGMESRRCWLYFPPPAVDAHDWATEKNEKIMEGQKEWLQFSCNSGIIHLETKQFAIVSSAYTLVY